ncbi:MAG: molybdopterin-dependent oxidoreductase [Verrucomicrobiae bacterium]|nr:molybdopterin-dependent oxidoreductase [Verrucomicrobiae bacterium]MCP5524310.1 molybdopterin-dependent oxidoreductase [Verrucomicrobiales bacterium]
MAHSLTTCTFCGVGCGIYLTTAGNRITGVYPSMSHPSNEGRICLRGWNVHEVASSPDRLRRPLLRRNGELTEVSWEEAFAFIAGRMREIRKAHGPEAFAFFNAPRCSNEESYLLQKLARAVIGTNNVNHGTGVYTNNSIDVLEEMLGWPATTGTIGDLAQSEVILVDGVDLAVQLPTIGGWVMRARLNGAKLIVIDARKHRVAESADHFLQLRPGTDTLLYGAMAKVLLDRGLVDQRFIRAHCRDFEGFAENAREYDLLAVAETCGVPADEIEAAALACGQARRVSMLYSTGSETRHPDSIRAMVNLALLGGHVGRPGSGIFALTEQNNLQGCGDMGVLPDRLPGYAKVGDPTARKRFERHWNTSLPETPGMGARACLREGGPVRAAWLCRYDPVTTATFCDAARALEQMDLVVMQHLFPVATMDYAHVVLPVVAFGEEEVTFTSTDRRVQLTGKVVEPPEGPLPAWRQLTEVARALGADWTYQSAAEVMREIARVTPIYGGVTYRNLARDYGRQWPCTADKPLGSQRLFEEGIPAGAFRFRPLPRPVRHTPRGNGEFPYALVVGQSLYYWHRNVLIQNSETLRREHKVLLLDYPEGFVEINDGDAREAGIRNGQPIDLVSAQERVRTTARVTGEVRAGTVYVPFFLRHVKQALWRHGEVGPASLSEPVFVRVEKA